MIEFRECLDKLYPYVPGRPIDAVKREYNLTEVYKLASNENPYGASKSVKKVLENFFGEANFYPDGNCTALREKIAKHYNISTSQLIFGAGTDELITLIGRALINKGDECITAKTTFPQYAASVLAMDGVVVYSEMKDYGYDLDDMVNKITDKTKLICIANPNNPTGTAFFREEQEAFLKRVPSNILVVMDEAYAEYVDDENYPDTLGNLSDYENLLLLKTFSKAYGLASLRVGYCIGSEKIIANLEKLRNPFNVAQISQIAANAAFDDVDFVKESVEKNKQVRDYLYSEFEKLELSYIPTYGNFVMVDVKKDSRTVFVDLMKEGLIVRPGYAFGMDTYLRVSIGTMDEMKLFIEVLKSAV